METGTSRRGDLTGGFFLPVARDISSTAEVKWSIGPPIRGVMLTISEGGRIPSNTTRFRLAKCGGLLENKGKPTEELLDLTGLRRDGATAGR